MGEKKALRTGEAARALPDPETLRSLFRYDPETGQLFWNKTGPGRGPIDRPAGSANADGYRRVFLVGREFLAHIIVMHMHGLYQPGLEVDHINRVRHDNRLCNLRMVDRSGNLLNSCRHDLRLNPRLGVARTKEAQWAVAVTIGRRKVCCGTYRSLPLALQVRDRVLRLRDDVIGEVINSDDLEVVRRDLLAFAARSRLWRFPSDRRLKPSLRWRFD